MKYGMIAGNGRFPLLALQTARKAGDEVVVIAIKEEASPEIESLASRCYWVSFGELSRLIDICHQEDVRQIMMCGQVKHAKIFSSIKPDWKLFKVLAALPRKNTDSLIGAVAKVLADDGIGWSIPRRFSNLCLLLKDSSPAANPPTKKNRISNTAGASLMPWPRSTSDKAWPSANVPASRSRPWRAPTPCCAAPQAW